MIHNAGFDHGFLNAELKRIERALIARERLIDTLLLARRKHPAGPNRLDDLCARYGIDNSHRSKHGALLDAEILAEVYVELIGARQAQLGLAERVERSRTGRNGANVLRERPAPLPPRLSEAERAAHRAVRGEPGRRGDLVEVSDRRLVFSICADLNSVHSRESGNPGPRSQSRDISLLGPRFRGDERSKRAIPRMQDARYIVGASAGCMSAMRWR